MERLFSTENKLPETGRRNWNLGIFVQDDWKATPKLTLNAGIRYEYESPLKIANNIGNHGLHLAYVVGENQVPLAQVPAVTLANTSLATQNSLQFPSLKSVSPRLAGVLSKRIERLLCRNNYLREAKLSQTA
jgi:outer membrane receptor protein involved in Fe transport